MLTARILKAIACCYPLAWAFGSKREQLRLIFPRDQLTPEAPGALQKAEVEKWWPIIKAAAIKAE